MKNYPALLACSLCCITTSAAAQMTLDRSRFQQAPVFSEDFSYASVNDEQFKARWATEFYTGVNNNSTEYASASQLELLPQQGYIKLRTDRLTLEQRQAATAAAAANGVVRPGPVPPGTSATAASPNGGSIGYASGKLISKVAVDSVKPATGNRFEGFTYGLFEIRCKLPSSGQGIMPAFWLYSPSTEIDIVDNLNEIPHRLLQVGVLDWVKRKTECGGETADVNCWTKGALTYINGPDLSQEFNTYSAVWSPEKVVFYFNDQQVLAVPAESVRTYNETARIVVNVGTRGADSFASGEMIIDYIRVWKFKSPSAMLAYRSLQRPRASRREQDQRFRAASSVK